MVGVDVGFENPTFACLEIDYEVSVLNLYTLKKKNEFHNNQIDLMVLID